MPFREIRLNLSLQLCTSQYVLKFASTFLLAFIIPGFLYSQYNSEIIDLTTDISVDANGTLTTEKSCLIKIYDKASNWIGDITIPYREGNSVSIIEAKILDKGLNEVRSLKRKEIETRSNISSIAFFEDDMEKAFSLNWGSYPYYITYTYKITARDYTYVAFWYP